MFGVGAVRCVLAAFWCAGLASSCVGGNLAAAALVRPLRMPFVDTLSPPHESFTVATAEGFRLDGWWLRPEGELKGIVVLLHGKDINRMHFAAPALRLLQQGLVLTLFDMRAHGRSGGEYVTYGAREVADVRAVMDATLAKWGSHLPVVLVGESLGAAVALQTAAVEPRVSAVVSAAAFANLNELVELHSSWLGVAARTQALAAAEAAGGFRVADISPERAARNVTVPVLVVHGSLDAFIPMQHALRIYESLAGPKSFLRLEGVNHTDVLLSDGVWGEIDRFINQVVRNIYEKMINERATSNALLPRMDAGTLTCSFLRLMNI